MVKHVGWAEEGHGQRNKEAESLLARLEVLPCCCERLADGWMDAGCRYHTPVRSWVPAGKLTDG